MILFQEKFIVIKLNYLYNIQRFYNTNITLDFRERSCEFVKESKWKLQLLQSKSLIMYETKF